MRSLLLRFPSACSRVIVQSLSVLAFLFLPSSTSAQGGGIPNDCDSLRDWAGHVYSCAVQSLSAPSLGQLSVDGGENGSVEIRNSADAMVHIVATKIAWLPDTEKGKELLSGVHVDLIRGRLSSRLDSLRPGFVWSVSFRVEVPSDTVLEITTFNGSVDIEGTLGRVTVHSVNGAIRLKRFIPLGQMCFEESRSRTLTGLARSYRLIRRTDRLRFHFQRERRME